MFTPDELENELSSNYDDNLEVGFDDQYLEIEDYDGSDDEFLEFDGAKSLRELSKSTRRVTFAVSNSLTSQAVVAFSTASYRTERPVLVTDVSGVASYKEVGGAVLAAPSTNAANDILMKYNAVDEIVAAGHSCDAVLDDGVIYAIDNSHKVTVTAQSKNASMRHFSSYIKRNPSMVVAMHLSSTDAAFYESEITIKRATPYGVFSEKRIALQDAFSPMNNLKDKIIISDPAKSYKIDEETLALMTIPAGATVTVTLVIGAVISNAVALARKATKAVKATPKVKKVAIKPVAKKAAIVKK